MATLRLFERHGGALYGMALGVLGIPTEAEDAIVEVAQELATGRGNYSYTRPVLQQLVRRAAALLRKRTNTTQEPQIPPADGEEWRSVGRVLHGKTDKERLAFYTWAATGLSVKDAAGVLDVDVEGYARELVAVLEAADLESSTQVAPLRRQAASSALLYKVEELVVDDPEREGSEEARARRRSQIRTRTARAKNWGSVLTWFPLLLALLVIAYMIYNFDAIKGRKPKPSPVPSVFPVEIDRGG